MNRYLVSGLLVAVAACGGGAADEFRAAAPSRQNLTVSVPKGGQALTGDVGELGGALGEQAELYGLTVGVSGTVNGGLFWVKALVEAVLAYEPTTLTETEAVWGPFTEPLKPDTWKFTIARDGTGFTYKFEGHPKTLGDEAFVSVIHGRHEDGTGRAGSGHFTVDWDAAQQLSDKPKEVGRLEYTYVRNDADDLTVTTEFVKVRDEETGQLIDASYAYEQLATGPGTLEFVIRKDMGNDGTAIERLAVKSRWLQDGHGRGDVKASGGDLETPLTVTECWDANFARTYYVDSVGWKPTEGDATSCVFDDASYTTL